MTMAVSFMNTVELNLELWHPVLCDTLTCIPIAKQELGKHIPAATNAQAPIE
jgi:hypothetical protein